MNVLRPLAARYADWLSLPDESTVDTSDETPETVRAMPVILHIEKAAPPARTPLLEAAAAAAVAVCLDERAEPGGEWHDDVLAWTRGRIRKVARRARGAHWRAVLELPGHTVEVAGAEVRALLPGLVRELPKEVDRLQVAGTDLPPDTPPAPPPDRPVLWLNPAVPMTAGKAAAQVGHGTMLLATVLSPAALAAWADTGYRTAVRTAPPALWSALAVGRDPKAAWAAHHVVAVRDAGFTEVPPGTTTVLAHWPG